jgi:predicted dehydrogenase
VARHRLGGLVAAVRGRLGGRGPAPLVSTLAAQLDAFAIAARGGDSPDLATAADGHATMVVIDAARARAAGGPRTLIDV